MMLFRQMIHKKSAGILAQVSEQHPCDSDTHSLNLLSNTLKNNSQLASMNFLYVFLILCASLLSLSPNKAEADKIDVMLACEPTPPAIPRRGAIYILDDSSSMTNWMDSNEVDPNNAAADPVTTRWDTLVDAFNDMIPKIGENVPIGLMIFNQSPFGAYVAYPMQNLDSPPVGPSYLIPDGTTVSSTVRELLPRMVTFNVWDPGTPTQGALEEAIRYLKGEQVLYGAQRAFNVPDHNMGREQWALYDPPGSEVVGDWGYGTDVWTNVDFLSHPNSFTLDAGANITPSSCTWSLDHSTCRDEKINGTATYISPFTAFGGGDSHIDIILMTDGGPAGPNSEAAINALIGTTDCKTAGEQFDGVNGDYDDRCLRKLAAYIGQTTDLNPSISGNQTASLSVIAVTSSNFFEPLLQDMASAGNGQYKWVQTYEEFVDTYQIMSEEVIPKPTPALQEKHQVLSAPATSFDFAKGLHSQEIFYPVQQASYDDTQSLGNLKAYKIDNDPPEVVDDNGQPVLDPTDGEIKDNSKSTWTKPATGNDGDNPTKGGAADQLPKHGWYQRQIFSDIVATSPLVSRHNHFNPYNPNITVDLFDNAVPFINYFGSSAFGNGLSIPDFNLADTIYDARAYFPRTRTQIRSYVRWAHRNIGAPLNSEPVVYESGSILTGTSDKTVFMGSDKGVFHAFDGATGRERFAYIPKEMLPTVAHKYHGRQDPTYGKRYGIDGSPVVVIDNQPPFEYVGTGSDRAVVVFGLRRGGHNYYALDIRNPDKPELAWKIIGANAVPFEKLAQTWSKPSVANVVFNAGDPPRKVLIFGGGYNALVQDFTQVRTKDVMGNAIYMVDPFDGTLLWMASNNNIHGPGLVIPEMEYSIPAQVSVVDNDGDGLSDMFVVGDMGGQIFRFDIINGDLDPFEIRGGRVGDFAVGGPAWHRRFFQKIDVSHAVVKGTRKLALGVGTGSVDKPFRKNLKNAYFMLFLDSPMGPPSSYTTLKQAHLKNRTNNFSGWDDKDGWFIGLQNFKAGEKMLTSSITINGVVSFATYLPPTPGPGCINELTTRQWVMDQVTGKPTKYYGTGTDPLLSRSVLSPASSAALANPQMIVTELGPMILTGEQQLYKDDDIGFPGLDLKLNKWEQTK